MKNAGMCRRGVDTVGMCVLSAKLLEALQLPSEDKETRAPLVQETAGERGAAWVSSYVLECRELQRGKHLP